MAAVGKAAARGDHDARPRRPAGTHVAHSPPAGRRGRCPSRIWEEASATLPPSTPSVATEAAQGGAGARREASECEDSEDDGAERRRRR
ncbi:hypothetical protein ACP70R_030191 [Stipagrostis hirtigluma subsp. patula]